jgi:serine/threonine protein kinase
VTDSIVTPKSKRYTIIKKLGEGGFATVYLARDEKLDRNVAIKTFKKSTDESLLARFAREARICQKLRHPNIIQIFDATIESAVPNIIMEYIDAGDLSELIARRPLSVDEALSIAIQVGNGLEYLHHLKILHRDLKPENIMIQAPFRAILMDFNLAFSNDCTILTSEGFAVGTPRFMAPEILSGAPASAGTDVFSLGLILHDMLTGGSITTDEMTLLSLTERVVPKPSTINSNVPTELDEFVLWATSNDPQLRCPTAEKFVTVLTKIKTELSSGSGKAGRPPINFHSESIKPEKKSRIRRRKFIPFLLLAVSIFLVLIFCWSAGRFNRSDGSSRHGEADGLVERLNPLHKLSMACDSLLPEYDTFKTFADEEARLFALCRQSEKASLDHCKLLLQIIGDVGEGTTFSYFLRYRSKLRLLMAGQDASHNNIDPYLAPLELLKKCNAIHWNKMTANAPARQQNIQIAHLMFLELWEQLKNSPGNAETFIEDLMTTFSNLPSDFRKSSPGKSLFHSLILCRLASDSKLIPADCGFQDLVPPYADDLLMKIRSALSLRNGSGKLSEMAFDLWIEDRLKDSFNFLKEARFEKSKLKLASPREDPIAFMTPQVDNVADLKNRFNWLILTYWEQTNLIFYLMNLSSSAKGLDVFLIEAAIDSLQFSWLGFNHLMSKHFHSMGRLDPTCKYYGRTYGNYWKEAAAFHLQDGRYSSVGYVVSSLNEITPSISALANPALNASVSELIESLKVKSPLAAVAMNVLSANAIRSKPADNKEIKDSFYGLCKGAEGLDDGDFDGWAALTCLVSNKLFTDLKKQGLNEERAILSVKLISILADRYTIAGGFPKSFLPYTNDQFEAYSNGDNLMNITLLHCYDSHILNNASFENEEPEIASAISAHKKLSYLAKEKTEGVARGEHIGASKLLRGKPLEIEDLLINPLLRR